MAINGTGVNEAIAVVLKAAKAVAGEIDDKFVPRHQITCFKISYKVILVFMI